MVTRAERLWTGIEQAPVLSGVRAAWREIAGDDACALDPFLKPGKSVATVYPCPAPAGDGCPRGVVVHGPGDIVAVCRQRPRQCEKLTLTKKDIVPWTLDVRWLATWIREGLGLRGPKPVALEGLSRTLVCGTYRPVAGFDFNVYLTIQTDAADVAAVVERLLARDTERFLLVLPTSDLITPATAERLQGRGAPLLPLAAITTIDDRGRLEQSNRAGELLDAFGEDVVGKAKDTASDGVAFFPTPPDATWSQVTIRFNAVGDVFVRVGDVSGTFNFTQMGMVDKRSGRETDQWRLLHTLALRNGWLTWKDADAAREVKAQYLRLVKDLKRFFRIADGRPIRYSTDPPGYEAVIGLSI